jgi:hypothetical protein
MCDGGWKRNKINKTSIADVVRSDWCMEMEGVENFRGDKA